MSKGKNVIAYSGRAFPKTTADNVEAILGAMKRKKVVSLEDMQAATGKKWVRRSLAAVKMTHKVVPVREGRKLLGFSLQRGSGTLTARAVPKSRFAIRGAAKSAKMVPLKDARTEA
jgi:hypothetical protein